MVNVAALYRLSSKKQVERKHEDEVDIPGQKKAVEEFLRTRPEWRLVSTYEEKGISAFKKGAADRDVLQDAFKDAAAGHWSVLIVFKADRLSRRSLEYPGVLAAFQGMNVQVWSVADQTGGKLLAIDSQMDKLVRFVEGWQAESESVNTGIRVTARQTQLAQEGRWNGTKIPFGYEMAAQQNADGSPIVRGGRIQHHLVPNANAATVREIYAEYIAGQSTISIAASLNRRGVAAPGGKLWRSDTVVYILKNPFYYGMLPYRYTKKFKDAGVEPILAPGRHAPILSKEVFDAAQSIRTAKTKIPLKQRAATHPLAGLLVCGLCGGTIGARVKRDKRAGGAIAESRWYRCLNHELRGTCSMGSVRAETVEESYVSELERRLTQPDELRTLLEERSRSNNERLRDFQEARHQLHERLKDVGLALKRIDRAYFEVATLTDDEYLQKKAEYLAERRAIEAELAKPAPVSEVPDLSVLAVHVREIRANWAYLTPEERKVFSINVTQAYGVQAVLFPGGRVELRPR